MEPPHHLPVSFDLPMPLANPCSPMEEGTWVGDPVDLNAVDLWSDVVAVALPFEAVALVSLGMRVAVGLVAKAAAPVLLGVRVAVVTSLMPVGSVVVQEGLFGSDCLT